VDRQKSIDILSGRGEGIAPAGLRAGLRLASWPYAGVMRLRRWAYRLGLLPSRAAGVPVICVGNLTTGGTGKTPMVAWVVERLEAAGRSPAILTRGYRAGPDGESDEARLLAERTGAPVIVNADRVAGAAEAVAGGADVLVMDDGFQHRRLRRDLDIVLIDAVEPFGFDRCLPGGLLREPLSALRDAGAVVVTHCDEAPTEHVDALADLLQRRCPHAVHARAVHRPVSLIDPAGEAKPLDALLGRRVYAFCGLGSPEHFFTSLGRLGARITGRRALEDHAAYSGALLDELAGDARRAEASVLVTTEKDHVKLTGLAMPAPLWKLAVRLDVIEGTEALVDRIARAAGFASPAGDE